MFKRINDKLQLYNLNRFLKANIITIVKIKCHRI